MNNFFPLFISQYYPTFYQFPHYIPNLYNNNLNFELNFQHIHNPQFQTIQNQGNSTQLFSSQKLQKQVKTEIRWSESQIQMEISEKKVENERNIEQEVNQQLQDFKEENKKLLYDCKYFSPDQAPLSTKMQFHNEYNACNNGLLLNNQVQQYRTKFQSIKNQSSKLNYFEIDNSWNHLEEYKSDFIQIKNLRFQEDPFLIIKNTRTVQKYFSKQKIQHIKYYQEQLKLHRQKFIEKERDYYQGKLKKKPIWKKSKWNRKGKKKFTSNPLSVHKNILMKNYIATGKKTVKKVSNEENQIDNYNDYVKYSFYFGKND